MADYSGHIHSTYHTNFYPDKGPYYFYSSKSWDESSTTVPQEYLSFLQKLFSDFVNRNYKDKDMVPRAKITWNAEKKEYTLHGFSLSMNGRDVEKYFGWENPCKHNWRKNNRFDYESCLTCNEIKCEHVTQNKERTNGVEDPRWVCNACGKVIEE